MLCILGIFPKNGMIATQLAHTLACSVLSLNIADWRWPSDFMGSVREGGRVSGSVMRLVPLRKKQPGPLNWAWIYGPRAAVVLPMKSSLGWLGCRRNSAGTWFLRWEGCTSPLLEEPLARTEKSRTTTLWPSAACHTVWAWVCSLTNESHWIQWCLFPK